MNTGTSFAGTLTSAPVRGLRARRDLRARTLKVPKPRISMCCPSLNACAIELRISSTMRAFSLFDSRLRLQMSSTRSAFVMAFLRNRRDSLSQA